MRIDLNIPYEPASVDRTQKPSVKPGDQGRPASAVPDTAASVQVSGLEAKVAAAPEIRHARVQQLRQAIDAGTYSVSDEQLAQAMMGDILKR